MEEPTPAKKITITLKKPYALLAACIALSLGGGFWMVRHASTNDRGLIINGIIHLDPGGADVFYAVLGSLSMGIGLFLVWSVVRLATRKEFRIILGHKAIVLPRGQLWRTDEVRLPYEKIVAIGTQVAGGQTLIVIESALGRHHVQSRLLPEGWPVEDVATALRERWRARDSELKTATSDADKDK